MHVTIVGAGLSGLATAISCALSGLSVTILEASKELIEVGFALGIGAPKYLQLSLSRLVQDYKFLPMLPVFFSSGISDPTSGTRSRFQEIYIFIDILTVRS